MYFSIASYLCPTHDEFGITVFKVILASHFNTLQEHDAAMQIFTKLFISDFQEVVEIHSPINGSR